MAAQPTDRLYATRDGRHVAVGAIEPKFWSSLCTAAGHPEWIARQGGAIAAARAECVTPAVYFATLTLDECVTQVSQQATAAWTGAHAGRRTRIRARPCARARATQ